MEKDQGRYRNGTKKPLRENFQDMVNLNLEMWEEGDKTSKGERVTREQS
jgi:hypothetical protein